MDSVSYHRRTDAERQQILAMYADGISSCQIAQVIGTSKQTVLRTLKRFGVERRHHKADPNPQTKICKRCCTEKSVAEFYGNNRTKCDSICKPCRLEYAAEYKVANRDRVRHWGRGYARRNKARQRENARAYHLAFPEIRRAAERRRYQANKAKFRAKDHDRRVAKIKAGGTFTPEEWTALCAHYGNRCLRCDQERKLTVDHIIPISKGGTNGLENLQPLCLSCNDSKATKVIDYRPDKSSLLRP